MKSNIGVHWRRNQTYYQTKFSKKNFHSKQLNGKPNIAYIVCPSIILITKNIVSSGEATYQTFLHDSITVIEHNHSN